MPDRAEANESFVAKFVSGTADEEQLNILIANAWREALKNSGERAEIAVLLGAQESELDPNNPPFSAEVRGAGTFGTETLIVLATHFAIGFAIEFSKGAGEEAGKRAAQVLRDLWTDYIHNRVSPPGSGRLGPEKEEIKEE